MIQAKRMHSASAALFPIFFALMPFAAACFFAIVAVVVADDANLTFGLFLRPKVKRADTDEVAAFRDTLHNTAMPVGPVHDVVIRECGRRQYCEGTDDYAT